MRLRPAGFISISALAILAHPAQAFAADLVFSGSLERLGHSSISVKLADRRVIDALLPATPLLSPAKIASQFNMGDQVQITCKPVQPVWEEDASRYQSLELTKLRFLRRPSPEELSKMLPFPTWRETVNLLAAPGTAAIPPDGPPTNLPRIADTASHDRLEHAREVNLDYASHMPNFVADEIAKRYDSVRGSREWHNLDTIETEITFTGNQAVRRQIRRDGRPWDRPFQALPGFKWYGGFGTEIRPLFDLQCPTTITYEGPADLRGKRLFKYRFNSPPDGCFGPFTVEYQRYNPARTGHFYIDDPGGNVIQYDEEASGFPSEIGFAQRREEVSWDDVRIGDATHLLPVAANFVVVRSAGERLRIEVEYKNHRHFETATDVTFPRPNEK